jgi:hypothetical protein
MSCFKQVTVFEKEWDVKKLDKTFMLWQGSIMSDMVGQLNIDRSGEWKGRELCIMMQIETSFVDDSYSYWAFLGFGIQSCQLRMPNNAQPQDEDSDE